MTVTRHSFIHTSRIQNNDTKMSLRLDKCAHIATKTGNIIRTEVVVVPKGSTANVEYSYK